VRSSRLRWVALALVAALMPAFPAAAYAPESTSRRTLEAEVYDARVHPTARGASMAAVMLRGGVVLAERAQDRLMIPASLMKLATTTAAVYRFGPGFRFLTRVERRGGTSAAPAVLYLIGGGDPTLATEYYRRRRFMPDADDPYGRPAFPGGSPTMEQLAGRIARSGIERVSGDLVLDETRFDRDRYPSGWPSRYFGYDAECAYASALTVNEGRTAPTRHYIVANPALQAGQELRRALSARGISIGGTIRFGSAPSSAVGVTTVASPTVAEIVDFINRYSANFQAEILFKSLGAAFGTEGSYAASEVVVRQVFDELNIPREGFNQAGGSGLSRDDRMSVRTLSRLLNAILVRPELAEVRDSIPVAGRTGTLLNRLDFPPTDGNLRGKTGYLSGVRGLAGWVTGPDGTPIVYAALYNGARSALALSAPLDLFALAAAFHPRA
jgi:D-alanyl-D-alanine carboxypeptidase/D-alanyl-D-alanine-endopeptidase (penicillin-binding protein 4)